MDRGLDYSKVFNRLSHMVVLRAGGKTEGAVDGLVTAVLATDTGLRSRTPGDLGGAIRAYFGLSLQDHLVQDSVERLHKQGVLLVDRTTGTYGLSADCIARIAARVRDASELELEVRNEWLSSLEETHGTLTQASRDELWSCLRVYMARAFQRHGAETVQLLAPAIRAERQDTKTLSEFLDQAVRANCRTVSKQLAADAVGSFFVAPTPARTTYLSQLLDGTFTFFALSVDEATSAYLRRRVPPLSLFLDTNFIFGILDLHSHQLSEVSRQLIEVIKANKLPFKLYYHEATLGELRDTIYAIADRLKDRRWSQAMSRAVVRSGQFSGLELQYHSRNAEIPIDPDLFLERYEHIPGLLSEHGFKIYRSRMTKDLDDERHLLVADYDEYIKRHRPNRPKPYKAMDHDIRVWQTVRGLKAGDPSILDGGSYILSVDYSLYGFDRHKRGKSGEPLVMLPNQLLQLLRPLVPTTDDFDRTFVETFAIPEFRVAGGDYEEAKHDVLDRLAAYSDLPEQTAADLLANQVLLDRVREGKGKPEAIAAAVENALAQENIGLLEEREAAQTEAREKEERLTEVERLLTQQKEARDAEAREADRKLADAASLLERQEAALRDERDRRERAEAEARQAADDVTAIQALQRRVDRQWIIVRLVAAAALALSGIAGIVFLPRLLSWTWWQQHDNRFGLQASSITTILALSWLIATPRHRAWVLGSLLVPVVVGAYAILGN